MLIQNQIVCGSMKLVMAYDGSGRRISKTRMRDYGNGVWETQSITHYTGIGTEIRENFAGESPETKVVVNMPEGLGRYGIEDAAIPYSNINSFEWYLKNNLGSTMLVYGLKVASNSEESNVLSMKAAYDYRAFGEQVVLTEPADKVTENFTGKELDDEIALNYFGARYLDPMLGMWISVDPKRQFSSPYLYAGNGYNPVNVIDPDGNIVRAATKRDQIAYAAWTKTLNKSEAEVVSRIEKSDIVVNWRLTNQPIKTMNNDPKTFEPMTAGGVTTGVDGERALNVTIFKGDLKNSGMHEFYHVDQANDFLQSDSKLTGTDWNKEYKANTLDYELDAYNRDGVNVTREDLKEGGYRW